MIDNVKITDRMRSRARIESIRRNSHIRHHFEVDHMTSEQRDDLGFLGEFACCELLGIDWESNIRDNYLTIDDFDFNINGKKIDVKTETMPVNYAKRLLKGEILDNDLYGRRLINKGQFNLLNKYDIVIFSLFAREHPDYWFPIGYLETKHILENYEPTIDRPDGGRYPFPASPVPTSILRPISDLMQS
jgi:hypothetical protein